MDKTLLIALTLTCEMAGGCATTPTGAGPGGGSELRSSAPSDGLDQIPVALFQVPPVYPGELRKVRITGYAIVDFVVDAQGNVVQVTVRETSHPEFGTAAVECVSRWKFRPGRKAGRNVDARISVPIRFELTPPPLPTSAGAVSN